MTYTINKSFVGMFEEKLKSFQKKFAKFGDGAVTYVKSEPYFNSEKKQFFVDIDVEGAYRVKGYTFVASLEWVDGKGENLIKKISSDVEVPEMYRTRSECDHCKTNRYRKYTVLLRNDESGEYVQVGKSCVVDYLGVNIENYASYLSIWDSLDEFAEKMSHERIGSSGVGYDVEEVLGETVEMVNKYGYISSRIAQEYGDVKTSTRVWQAISRYTVQGEIVEPYVEISESSKEKVAEIREFVNGCDSSDDYVHNIQLLLSLSGIDGSNLGLVVSAVGFYLREVAKKKDAENVVSSEYIGSVGDKVEFTATPKCVYSTESDFGMYYIYKFECDGNVIVWKTSKYLEDVEITIKGTVKALEERNGVKQTEVTRCRVKA